MTTAWGELAAADAPPRLPRRRRHAAGRWLLSSGAFRQAALLLALRAAVVGAVSPKAARRPWRPGLFARRCSAAQDAQLVRDVVAVRSAAAALAHGCAFFRCQDRERDGYVVYAFQRLAWCLQAGERTGAAGADEADLGLWLRGWVAEQQSAAPASTAVSISDTEAMPFTEEDARYRRSWRKRLGSKPSHR